MLRYYPIYQQVPLFSGLAEEELMTMLRSLDAHEQRFKKGSFLLEAGCSVNNLGIVLNGSVQIIKEDILGNRNILSLAMPGELFAEAFACLGAEPMTVSVIAAEDTRVLFIDYRRIIAFHGITSPFQVKLIENMMFIFARKNMLLTRKINVISQRSIREKLLHYLSEQADISGKREFRIPFDRQEMADYLCVDRSALSAALAKLRGEGLIAYQKNHFKLL